MLERKPFNKATWQHKKGIAQLIYNQVPLITIKFGTRISEVHLENRILQIKKSGFWSPKITISEGQNVLLTHEITNMWKSRADIKIGRNRYFGKQKMMFGYSIVYKDPQGFEVLSFELDAWKWKPVVTFKIKEPVSSPSDVVLLLILGYYSIRKMKQEGDGAAIVAVTASTT